MTRVFVLSECGLLCAEYYVKIVSPEVVPDPTENKDPKIALNPIPEDNYEPRGAESASRLLEGQAR
jgi:hypothetical protein